MIMGKWVGWLLVMGEYWSEVEMDKSWFKKFDSWDVINYGGVIGWFIVSVLFFCL